MAKIPSDLPQLKQQLTSVFESCTEYSEEANGLLAKAFENEKDSRKHGNILWALMDIDVTSKSIIVSKWVVYIQYYYIWFLYKRQNRPIIRWLSDSDLGYLGATTSLGLEEGHAVFTQAFQVGDISMLTSLSITEAQFQTFFKHSPDSFNFVSFLETLDTVRLDSCLMYHLWTGHQSAFVGLLAPGACVSILSFQGPGSFLIRFNSSGSLSAVIINSTGEVVSHRILPELSKTTLSIIALISRSSSMQLFSDPNLDASVPKAGVLAALKKAAKYTDKQVSDEITFQTTFVQNQQQQVSVAAGTSFPASLVHSNTISMGAPNKGFGLSGPSGLQIAAAAKTAVPSPTQAPNAKVATILPAAAKQHPGPATPSAAPVFNTKTPASFTAPSKPVEPQLVQTTIQVAPKPKPIEAKAAATVPAPSAKTPPAKATTASAFASKPTPTPPKQPDIIEKKKEGDKNNQKYHKSQVKPQQTKSKRAIEEDEEDDEDDDYDEEDEEDEDSDSEDEDSESEDD